MNDVYGADIAKARRSQEKASLAAKLLTTAADSKDPANRYVLLETARNLAVQAGAVRTALSVLWELESYDLDALALYKDALADLSKTARDPADWAALVGKALELVDVAAERDDYKQAGQFMAMAVTWVRGARDAALNTRVADKRNDLREIEQTYRKAAEAQETLKGHPRDSAASATVGRYRCYIKGQWESGLPSLAEATDEYTRTAAAMELSAPASPDKQLELADLWWTVAEREKGRVRETIRLHAARWYVQALPKLTGLLKAKADRRLQEVDPAKLAALNATGGADKPPELPKRLALDLGNGVKMDLVLIPPGEFLMGSPVTEKPGRHEEGPQRPVKITRPFYMSACEVTQEQFRQVTGDTLGKYADLRQPVTSNWTKADAFCKTLSDRTGRMVRLPTEAEWEYACRAGTTTRFYFGDNEKDLEAHAWFDANGKDAMHPVGQKKPNPWGLYDMYGNAREWCADWYAETYSGLATVDSTGPETGDQRVMRGGDFHSPSRGCWSAFRRGLRPEHGWSEHGFRVAVEAFVRPTPTTAPSVVPPATAPEPLPTGPPPQSLALDLGNNVKMDLILIPAGEFLMGSPETEKGRRNNESPQRVVKITRPFYMGVFEVTQEQFRQVTGHMSGKFDDPKEPVSCINWPKAEEFCKKLSALAGRTVRPPTEAEWEYACRADTTTRFSFGDDGNDLDAHAWFKDNSQEVRHPVGQKKPNPWGLYDMHGNVREWCSDWFAETYEGLTAVDPKGPETGDRRVMRGGWITAPIHACRSAYRTAMEPEHGYSDHGLRVVVETPAGTTSTTEPSVVSPTTEPENSKTELPSKFLALDLGNNVKMDLVVVQAGEFVMGTPDKERLHRNDEGPQRIVRITRPFYMGIYEVTQEQFLQVMGTTSGKYADPKEPANSVSWPKATEFCKKLSDLTNRTVHLPTEAEWEYACRAGTTTHFSFGDDWKDLDAYTWFKDNSQKARHPVGQKKPNPWGLYDMHGNVREWCSDWYAETYEGLATVDPKGPETGVKRVMRGGWVTASSQSCRSAYRPAMEPECAYPDHGLRVVVDAPANPVTKPGS